MIAYPVFPFGPTDKTDVFPLPFLRYTKGQQRQPEVP